MSQHSQCPACGTKIPKERHFGGMAVCECGWTSSGKHNQVSTHQNDRICLSIGFFAAFLVAGFIHIVNWDSHAISIIPLKTSQLLGSATTDELNQIVEICLHRNKVHCAEEALLQIYETDSTQSAALARLGELQTRAEDFQASVKTYDEYWSIEGVRPSSDDRFNYAKALAATNQTDKAEKHFKWLLRSKPGTLQISVTRHYIEMLVKNERYRKAKATLDFFRNQGTNTKLFMEKEYQMIKAKLT